MNAPPDNTTPAVEVTHLRKVYGSGHTEVVAIRDVSMEVARGEIGGMLGPSGAGKSTLLTAIALINPPTAGQITIGGKPVLDGRRALVDLRAFRRRQAERGAEDQDVVRPLRVPDQQEQQANPEPQHVDALLAPQTVEADQRQQ